MTIKEFTETNILCFDVDGKKFTIEYDSRYIQREIKCEACGDIPKELGYTNLIYRNDNESKIERVIKFVRGACNEQNVIDYEQYIEYITEYNQPRQ